MLSVASLLNPVSPAKPERRGTRLPSSPTSSLCTTSSTQNSPQLSSQSFVKKPKMIKDGAIFTKGKIKGEVNYPPFEDLDEETMRQVQKFQVYPVGKITEFARHIPYNSEKKSFLEKTGRESFEVFQYTFKVAGDEKEYIVMWDYNTGLVRITPFFKCCKYSKTTPAKMLNMNPGLKEITHSITGGALAAQGYWMPYSCALAVCTTFCAHIAGALVPIFGPTFPSQCVPPEAPEHGRMIIDSTIIVDATAEAEAYRLQYSSLPATFTPKSTTPASTRESYSPQRSLIDQQARSTPPYLARRMRLKRALGADRDGSYGTPPTESDIDTNASETSASSADREYFHSPVTPNSFSQPAPGWEALNMLSHSANSAISVNIPPSYKSGGANPVLSAIPRSSGLADMQMSSVAWRGGKRRVEEAVVEENENDADAEYDGEESGVNSEMSISPSEDGGKSDGDVQMEGGVGSEEKKAAWLLMKLSVRDGEMGSAHALGMGMGMGCASEVKDESEGPRVKRRRATSC